jgi:CRP-like cAMP-binding protein
MRSPPTVDELALFLARNALCRSLTPAEVAEVIFVVQVELVDEQALILREGDPGDAWFLVYDGMCTIERHGRELATLGRGAFFGELSVLDGAPRSASVRAQTPAILLRFPARALNQLLAVGSLAAHKIVLEMTRALAQRMRALLDDTSMSRLIAAPDSAVDTGATP